jgi:hypothetical protein
MPQIAAEAAKEAVETPIIAELATIREDNKLSLCEIFVLLTRDRFVSGHGFSRAASSAIGNGLLPLQAAVPGAEAPYQETFRSARLKSCPDTKRASIDPR